MPRPIDADAFRKEVQEYVLPITTNNLMGAADAYHRILHLLDDAPTIDPAPQWIPVTERLPEKHTIVLCYKDGQRRLGYYIGAEYGKGVAAFRHPKDQFSFGVTHWMPLPKPPEMDGGAENEHE